MTTAAPFYAGQERPTPGRWREPVEVPDRTHKQRMDALQNANRIRTMRKALKADIKEGRAKASAYIIAPPDFIETMKVFDLVLATPGWGSVKTNKLMAQCQISPSKTVGGLSQRQRAEISSKLPRW